MQSKTDARNKGNRGEGVREIKLRLIRYRYLLGLARNQTFMDEIYCVLLFSGEKLSDLA
jgi:hypothetical protein